MRPTSRPDPYRRQPQDEPGTHRGQSGDKSGTHGAHVENVTHIIHADLLTQQNNKPIINISLRKELTTMNTHTTNETITTNAGAVTLEYADSFAKDMFVKHIMSKYGDPKANPLLYLYAVRTLELIIDYGLEYHNASKNQLSYFLFDVIPDVEHAEIVAYCDNDILTNNARMEKYDYWDTKGTEA